MRNHSLLLSLSLLASCASAPAPSAEIATVEPLPGLGSASGPRLSRGKPMPVPESVSRLLLSLPARDVLASQELRQRYLQGNVLVQEVPGRAGGRDYLVVDRNGSSYGFWVRSFQGARPGLTGYLVEVRGTCAELQGTDAAPVAAAERQCGVTGTRYFDSGIRAYRVVEGQPLEDVTASIAPDADVSKAQRERYASMGASAIFADDQNLEEVPVLRWVVEFDPELSAPKSDPKVFDYGHQVHAGFVVWNGERFERRATVPRALWSCREAGRRVECPPHSAESDPFVID